MTNDDKPPTQGRHHKAFRTLRATRALIMGLDLMWLGFGLVIIRALLGEPLSPVNLFLCFVLGCLFARDNIRERRTEKLGRRIDEYSRMVDEAHTIIDWYQARDHVSRCASCARCDAAERARRSSA